MAPDPSTVSCSYKRTLARLLIGVLVYAQLAVAAYACGVGSSPGSDMAMGPAAVQVEPLAHDLQMDADQPTLCVAHCRSGQQNADAKPLPVPPLALVAGYFSLKPLSASGERDSTVLASGDLPPLADPPHTVLHCCLRI